MLVAGASILVFMTVLVVVPVDLEADLILLEITKDSTNGVHWTRIDSWPVCMSVEFGCGRSPIPNPLNLSGFWSAFGLFGYHGDAFYVTLGSDD